MAIVIRVPLIPTSEQASMMADTMSDYTKACNYVSRYIFDNGFPLSSKTVNQAIYKTIRQRFNLGSQMAQSVIRDVIARYKTVKTQISKQRVACGLTKTGKLRYIRKTLEHLERPIKFSRPQVCFRRDRDYRLLADRPKTRGVISMRMTSGVSIRVQIAKSKRVDYPALLRSYKSIWAMRLECDRGKWYALIAVEEVIEDQIDPYLAVGVDLEALDACSHLLGGGLAEPNVTLDAGSGRLTPQIKKPSLSLDRAGWMWYTVYITPDGALPCLSVD